jgi:23S rRNA (pseudouridine1915-N3)-methyltransferase
VPGSADLDSVRLAARLLAWQRDARPVAIVIGGPDGIDPGLKAQADESLRLSSLTLPHALVRPLLAEQLYRAWTIAGGHPYHRE